MSKNITFLCPRGKEAQTTTTLAKFKFCYLNALVVVVVASSSCT